MAPDLEVIMERAFENAFARALDEMLQAKAEEIFKKALRRNSPLGRKLEEKIEQGFQNFLENGIRWEKSGAGFKPGKKSHA